MIVNIQKVTQGDVEFYIGKIQFSMLRDLVSIEHRIITGYDEEGQPIYNDKYQRKIETSRVGQIKDFLLNDPEASFPNSIILALPTVLIEGEIDVNENDFGLININQHAVSFDEDTPNYIQIIDGQHRFAGLKKAIEVTKNTKIIERLNNFEFVVSFFIDPPIDYQALLFSTINRNTKNVSKDLAYDLFGLERKDSPQKTCLAICLKLNRIDQENTSPFERRIKLLGRKNRGEISYISQQMFIRTILKLICKDEKHAEVERFKDRNHFKQGGTYHTIFRSFYASGEDSFIYKTIKNFFSAVREAFVDNEGNSYWDIGITPDNVFQRTIGFLALVDILVFLFHKGMEEGILTEAFFLEKLKKAADIVLFDGNGDSLYPYNTKGKNSLSEQLMSMIAN